MGNNLPPVHTFCYASADLTNKIDLIVCLGGDGTLLYASSLFQVRTFAICRCLPPHPQKTAWLVSQESVPPVLAFHLGSLGFLMSHDFAEYRSTLEKTFSGKASLTLRSRLHCTLSMLATPSTPSSPMSPGDQSLITRHQVIIV